MVNIVEGVEENINYIKNIFSDKKIQSYIVEKLWTGNKKSIKINEQLESDIETLKAVRGMVRAKIIGNTFCNSHDGDNIGIESDIFAPQALPKISVNHKVLLTLKSVDKKDKVLKRPSNYMKDFCKVNDKINPQINMFDNIDKDTEENVNLGYCYYGIIAYHFTKSNLLEYVSIVFCSENMNEILLEIDFPKEILMNNSIVGHEDKNIFDNRDLGESLKNKLKIKKMS